MNSFSNFKEFFFYLLFFWFSFSPEYLQVKFQLYVLIILGINIFLEFFLFPKFGIKVKNLANLAFWLFIFSTLLSIKYAYSKKIAGAFFYIPLFSIFVFYQAQFLNLKEYKFKTARVLSVFAFLVFLFGLQEFLFKQNILYKRLIPNPYLRFLGKRMISFHYHPSVLATYFLIVLSLAIFLIKTRKSKSDLMIGTLGIFSCLLGILLTFTRTAFLILFISFFLYFLGSKRKYVLYLVLIFLLLLVSSSLLSKRYEIFSRFSLSNSYHIGSIRYRLERIPIAIDMFEMKPLTGVGFGNFRYLFDIFYFKETPYEFKIPDNMYLSLLSETGILGLGSFFLFLFSLFYSSLKKIRNLAGEDKEFLKISILGFCMLLLNMFSYDMFYWHMPLFFFWFYAGLLANDEV